MAPEDEGVYDKLVGPDARLSPPSIGYSLAEFPAQESQARERKPKKGTGRSGVGGWGCDVTLVNKGHEKGAPIECEGRGVRRVVR